MDKWFVYLNDMESGPYTLDQMRQMISGQQLKTTSMVRKETSSVWLMPTKDSVLSPLFQTAPAVLKTAPACYDPLSRMVRFHCPSCGQKYKIDNDVSSGKKVECGVCGTSFTIVLNAGLPAMPAAERKLNHSTSNIEGNITCPHCWKTFSAGDVLYISMHPNLLGDELLGPDAQKRFMPVLYNSQGIPLDDCEMACTDMACPHCHLQVPSTILDMESLYFSIVGAPSSGKSYFLTALVHQLRKTLPEYASTSFSDVDPRLNQTLNSYENRLFMATDKSQVVSLAKTEEIGMDFSDQTSVNGLPVFLPKPFIFQTVPLSAGKNGGAKFRKNLIFYDNAGEHFEPGRENVSNPAALHLAHSDAIIYIFDPLNDPEMRKVCNKNDPQMEDISKVGNQTVLFSEMVSRIRRHANMSLEQKSSIPLVIAVAKYDAWENDFPVNLREVSPFSFNRETLETEFDSDVLYNVSFTLREYMMKFIPGLIAQAETFFEKVLFVPVSTFGTLAVSSGILQGDGSQAVGIIPEKVNPVWIEVPFFALLEQEGLLAEKKQVHPDALPLQVRDLEDKVVFAHPDTNRRVQLPQIYAGHCISIGGKLYQLPAPAGGHQNDKTKKDYWK